MLILLGIRQSLMFAVAMASEVKISLVPLVLSPLLSFCFLRADFLNRD